MQRGIDSFFKRLPSKPKNADAAVGETPPKAPKRRKPLVISSDEDEVAASPQESKKRKTSKVISSDDEVVTATPEPDNKKSITNGKKPALSKLKKHVDPSELFGGETKRVVIPKPKTKAVLEFENEEIDKSLMEVDLEESLRAAEEVETVPKTEIKSTAEKKPKIISPEPAKPKAAKPKATTPRAKKEKPPVDLETSVLTDEERHERKRMSAVLYQKYKNRSSCLNPGSKEIPKGSPNCLSGLTFVVTGVLESMEREEAEAVIKEYGGKVMTVVGKKLKYLVVGEEAGPKKLAVAEELNIPILSEDGLFDLIREKSGLSKSVKEEKLSPKEQQKATSKEKVKTEEKSAVRKSKVKEEKEETKPRVKEEKSATKHKIKEDHPTSPDAKKAKHNGEPVPAVTLKVKKEPSSQTPVIKATETKKLDENSMAWVDKHKPTNIKEIVGQAGAASNVTKLMNWLTKWYVNHDGKNKPQRPNPWAKNDDGSFYKAALLSGPPGIGKTTTATLVAKELGFDAVEFNASDTRSKRLLKDEVSTLLSNKSLSGYFSGQGQAVSRKHVLIMDEVDGMAGNEDRGGMQELIALIKDSSIPIICMCNDRTHPKIRSLVNYCYDLRFQRPRLEQIKGKIMSICFKEKVKITPAKVEEIISATNNDIRQSINHIALLSAKEDTSDKAGQHVASKDLKLGPWEVVRKVFTAEEHKRMSLADKSDLFFHDYSLAPLFVQQNYLQVTPKGNAKDVLAKVAATADALSLGDLIDKRIRANSAWSLLPTQAFFSSVLPGEHMSGHFTGQINFPGWLGKNSRTGKRARLAQELHDHTRVCTSGSRLSVRLDYAPFLLNNICRPLAKEGQEGVPAAIEVMKDYHLLREDLDSLVELTSWPGKKSPLDAVDGRVKAALTRTYNKEVMAYSYSAQAGIKKKKAEAAGGGDEDYLAADDADEEGAGTKADSEDDEDKDNLELDGLIKTKKKSTAASTSKAAGGSKKAASSTASKSKAKAKK
ncbi:replication factor C subunit 1 [Drosophila kikkawai]|uniref:Replication factor C subunit 1 n=1 Tax=Drosophila kikkawai TaxID=30033 RepID=A0A6P4J7Z7_DROKI|nr:replication factor C subunit 1 [Drosophila kikkawai]